MPVIQSHRSSFLDLSYPCHILQVVIIKLKKDMPCKYQIITNQYQISNFGQKKLCQTSKRCTKYIPSDSGECIFSGSKLHVSVICLAYPCHIFFLFSRMRHANEIQLVIELWFESVRFLHTTAQRSSIKTRFICHRCSRGLLCPRPSPGSPPQRPQSPLPPPALGLLAWGSPARASGGSWCRVRRCRPVVGAFLEVLASARVLNTFTPLRLAPAMPSNSL